MKDSRRIDSPLGVDAMTRAYSNDLRLRVIEAVESGASRHEAADWFETSVSSAVRWVQRWKECGSCTPKPRGGSVSPLEEHARRILALVAERPDLTLEEGVAELRKWRIPTSKSSLARFFERHDITFKKEEPACGGTAARRRGAGAPAVDAGASQT
jgi:transposase